MRRFLIKIKDELEIGIGVDWAIFFVDAESPCEAEQYVRSFILDEGEYSLTTREIPTAD